MTDKEKIQAVLDDSRFKRRKAMAVEILKLREQIEEFRNMPASKGAKATPEQERAQYDTTGRNPVNERKKRNEKDNGGNADDMRSVADGVSSGPVRAG